MLSPTEAEQGRKAGKFDRADPGQVIAALTAIWVWSKRIEEITRTRLKVLG